MSYRVDKQVIDTHTDTHTLTDTQTGAMTIPEGQNWPRVKNAKCNISENHISTIESPYNIISGIHNDATVL